MIEARGPPFAGAMRGRGIQSVSLDTQIPRWVPVRSQISDRRSQSSQLAGEDACAPSTEISKSE